MFNKLIISSFINKMISVFMTIEYYKMFKIIFKFDNNWIKRNEIKWRRIGPLMVGWRLGYKPALKRWRPFHQAKSPNENYSFIIPWFQRSEKSTQTESWKPHIEMERWNLKIVINISIWLTPKKKKKNFQILSFLF